MFLRIAAACAVGVAVCFNPCALAQQLEETVVTATRNSAAISEIDVPVMVISREEIERSLASDVGEILAQHAGLEVARNGGPGQTASLFMRGTNSNHAIVMIDGVRINPGTLGGAAIQNITPESIERIEVVEGPRSALYGTDAIGGVINIFTRAGAQNGLSASVAEGRYASHSVNADGATALGDRGNVGFSFGRNDSDGFPAIVGNRDDRGYRNTTVNLSGRFAASDALDLKARVWRASGNTQYSDFFATPIDEDFTNAAYSLQADWHSDRARTGHLALSRADDDIQQNQSPDYLKTRRYALDAQTDLQYGHQNLTLGALLTRENARALSFGLPYDVDTRVDMGFVQDRIKLGTSNLLLALGYTDHQTFGHQMTWNAEFGHAFSHATRVSVAAGTAFHAPDATDRFGFGGNPQLRPEFSKQVETSIHQAVGKRQELWATFFDNKIDDLINFVVTDPQTFDGHNDNVDRARIRGLQIGYGVRSEHWHLRIEASFNDPRNQITGERLLRRAQNTWALATDWHSGRLELGLDALRSGVRYDFGFPSAVAMAPYTLLNLSARYNIGAHWSVQARLDNATDERYQLVNGYNTPRRSLLIGARCRFN